MMAGVSQVFMWTRNITFNYENILMSINVLKYNSSELNSLIRAFDSQLLKLIDDH